MIVQAVADSPDREPAPALRLVADNTRPGSARTEIVELYEAEFRRTARLAYLLCGNTQQADDLAHDAFLRLYEHWDRVNDPAKRRSYLRTILVNLAHSAHRREFVARRHAGAPMLMEGAATTSTEDDAIWRSARPEVLAALGTLSERQRTAVVLRHWMGMTEGEIAEAMSCSIGSVRTHIARGHQSLALQLAALGGTR
ncbi:MAG: sigma-70 family RNA polymerase sigma factor [Actinobacteria bacterium]|nr:sigma-70 family RNA polymerase sigma factor [Actinomycetota bacterium]